MENSFTEIVFKATQTEEEINGTALNTVSLNKFVYKNQCPFALSAIV
jgi:hypothetical protein